MAPTLESSPLSSYKHQSGPFSGYVFPQMTQQNDHQSTHHGLKMWLGHEDYSFPFSTNFGEIDDLVVPEVANIDCSSNYLPLVPLMTSCGMSEGNDRHDQLPAWPELYCNGYSNCNSGYGASGDQSGFDVGYFQLGDNNNGEGGNLFSPFGNYLQRNNCAPTTTESWGFQSHSSAPISEENNVKVGRYSVEERRNRILRYLKKRNQRNFNKTIKYACRKTLADRRVRIRGRFAKNNEEESQTNNNVLTPQEESSTFQYTNANKDEQYYDEEWLQEAMSSLMFGPYIPG